MELLVMPSGAPNEATKTPMMWFFVALGLLLLISTLLPSCHSRQKLYAPPTVGIEHYRPPHFSPTPRPSGTHTSQTPSTPPAKPATPYTPPPPPPH